MTTAPRKKTADVEKLRDEIIQAEKDFIVNGKYTPEVQHAFQTILGTMDRYRAKP